MKRRTLRRVFPVEIVLLVLFAALLQLGFFPDGLDAVLVAVNRLLGTTAGLLVNL